MGIFKIVASLFLKVVGGATDQGDLPWLVSSPATDNIKCTCIDSPFIRKYRSFKS